MTDTTTEIDQDSGWSARRKARVRAALEVLAGQSTYISTNDLQELVAERVPLMEYDMSQTSSKATRAWIDLRWNLSAMNNGGWVQMSSPGIRITHQGRNALATFSDPEDFTKASEPFYNRWDEARKIAPSPLPADPAVEIVHPGEEAAHAYRSVHTLLSAWRSGDSALNPGHSAWTSANAETLVEYLATVDRPVPTTLDGLTDDDARLLAAEGLALVLVAFRDVPGVDRRRAMRNVLLPHSNPPGLPHVLSGDMEHGLVGGGKRLAAEPLALLAILGRILLHWWRAADSERQRAWEDPWAFRDLVRAGAGDDDVVASLLCVLAHPGAFTTLLRREDRDSVLAAFGEDVDLTPSGDAEQDLRDLTVALQQREGGRGVDYFQAPYVQRWRGEEQGHRGRGWSAARSISRTGCPAGSSRASSRSRSAG